MIPQDPRTLLGVRVRAVIEGKGESIRVEERSGMRLTVPYRATVVGEVTGWETDPSWDRPGEYLLTLAGYGRVPMSACRRARWWQR